MADNESPRDQDPSDSPPQALSQETLRQIIREEIAAAVRAPRQDGERAPAENVPTSAVPHPSLPVSTPATIGILPSAAAISAVPLLSSVAPHTSLPPSQPPTTSWSALLSAPSSSMSSSQSQGVAKAFKLASAIPPIPAKLVEKIRTLKFVEMKELLPDNVTLVKNMEMVNPSLAAIAATTKPKLREVQSILTWVSCFTSYIAILSESHPQLVRPLLAYQCLMIREARKNGGVGWMLYDRVFRQNAQEDTTTDWSKLDASLHAATFLAFRAAPNSFCPLCFDSDHNQGECALAPLSPTSPGGPPTMASTPIPYRQPKRAGERLGTTTPTCISWNKGRCFRAPAPCNYRHRCATCGREDHPACECSMTPPDSFYKRPPSRPAKSPRVSDMS